jgi:hypothetical protein
MSERAKVIPIKILFISLIRAKGVPELVVKYGMKSICVTEDALIKTSHPSNLMRAIRNPAASQSGTAAWTLDQAMQASCDRIG